MGKNWDRTFKNAHRQNVIIQRGWVQRAFFMPSGECRCVKLALDAGLINKRSFIVALEELPGMAKKIRQYFESQGFKVVDGFEYEATIQPENRVKGGTVVLYSSDTKPVDLGWLELQYGFFDFCGEPDAAKIGFIHRLNFAPNADISFTFQTTYRNNNSRKKFEKWERYEEATGKVIGRLLETRGANVVQYYPDGKFTDEENAITVALANAGLSRYVTKLEEFRAYGDKDRQKQVKGKNGKLRGEKKTSMACVRFTVKRKAKKQNGWSEMYHYLRNGSEKQFDKRRKNGYDAPLGQVNEIITLKSRPHRSGPQARIIVDLLLKAKSPQQKKAANRELQKYLDQEAKIRNRNNVYAGIKAAMTRAIRYGRNKAA